MQYPAEWDQLTKEEKSFILDGNLYNVGGRDPEVLQLAFTVEQDVKACYPVNGVPITVAERVAVLKIEAHRFETAFCDLIRAWATDIIAQRKPVSHVR